MCYRKKSPYKWHITERHEYQKVWESQGIRWPSAAGLESLQNDQGTPEQRGASNHPQKKGHFLSACEVLDCNLAQQLPGSDGQRTQQSGDTQPSTQDILTACQISSPRSDTSPQIHKPERTVPPEDPMWTRRFPLLPQKCSPLLQLEG